MKINKVLKKLKNEGKIEMPDQIDDDTDNKYPTSELQTHSGFHAKANSQEGAERQRSMGNRMWKTSNSK